MPALLTRMSRPSHRLLGRRHQRLDLVAFGEIAREDMDAVAELAGERVEHLAPRARERDGRALRVQRTRDRAADAAGRAGDQRGLAGEIEHGCPPPCGNQSR